MMRLFPRASKPASPSQTASSGSSDWLAPDLPRVSASGCLLVFSLLLIITQAGMGSLLWSNLQSKLSTEAQMRIAAFDSMIGRTITDLQRTGALMLANCNSGGREVLIQQSLQSKIVSQIHWAPAGGFGTCSPIESDQLRIAHDLDLVRSQTDNLGQDVILSSNQTSLLIGWPLKTGGYLIGEIAHNRALAVLGLNNSRELRAVTRRWDGPVLSDSAGLIEPMTPVSRSDLGGPASAWPLIQMIRVTVQSDRFPLAVEMLTTPVALLKSASRYALAGLALAVVVTLIVIAFANVALARRISLERRLKIALRKRQFEPVIQPIVDAQTGICRGGEVLMRWRHPARGLLAPAEFLGLADKMGLTAEMTMMIIARARDQLIPVLKNHPELYFSFNVEASQLRDPAFGRQLEQLFESDDVQPTNVVLELVEREAIDAQARVALARLRGKGYRVAIDDFGTGQSSLALLSEIEFDVLKIDRSFITSIGDTDVGRPVLDAILELARQLNVGTIAEGVETPEQHALLVEGGVKSIQGYLVSKPMPVAQFGQWLYSRKNHKAYARSENDPTARPAPERLSSSATPTVTANPFIADALADDAADEAISADGVYARHATKKERFPQNSPRRQWANHFASDMNAFVPI